MRPALLVTLEYPPQVGGIAIYLSRLVEALPFGLIQVLASPVAGRDTHATDVRSAVPIYRRRLLSRWLWPHWLPTLWWVEWLYRKEGKPSVIIVSHILPMGHVAWLMKRRRGIPYVVICHGMDLALALEAHGRKRAAAKRILGEAALVVANSSYTAGLAEALGARHDDIRIIHPSTKYALDFMPAAAKVAAARERYVPGGEFLWLTAGRLVKRKGFDDCLRALAELKLQGLASRLVIVGDGPERKNLEVLAGALGVTEQAVFAGQVSDDELAVLFAASDAFVMVPRGLGPDVEGFGIVYLEANQLGKPVIGSRSGGVPEAVLDGKTGLLVNPGDAAGLAVAIRRLAEDPELRRRLGAAGRERVLGELAWRNQVLPLQRYLENLSGPHPDES